MSVEHILKTQAEYWDAIERGEKNFEVRRDDKGFQKGDTLVLRRISFASSGNFVADRRDGHFREITRKVTYILTGGQFGIEAGYVVMGLKK